MARHLGGGRRNGRCCAGDFREKAAAKAKREAAAKAMAERVAAAAKVKAERDAAFQVKADAERARQKCEQLEGTLQALEARNKEDLAALQASLNDALAQRDAAQAELPPLQEQLAAALGAHSGNDELQAALEQ